MELNRPSWRKSSRSNGGGDGNCVELAYIGPDAAVRDSKNTVGPRIALPGNGFRALVRHVRG
ncbi:uncharacterized protein DUF397 [Herbihabitans rhizosphaerae]|uniref:Uncharacterized protein DUF397 n=1 Tax=Herbihabitans rhizosphaerae TaxID=1872711 RepID=A0A4Q7KEU3_9PSEU|nr:DUF397 domain-containing protein [Herbihabitans rhizosphaerae]RZS31380.1 uncharacterized protein DUF397 [Herbihabitans rhizosphaerae]